MADKKKVPEKAISVEFKVSMHCKACERTVAKVLSKYKGVETFSTDMMKHKVIVKGRIIPEKVLKKLKKKTGKRVEIVAPKDGSKSNGGSGGSCNKKAWNSVVFDEYLGDSSVFTMFSDENPNAYCSIM